MVENVEPFVVIDVETTGLAPGVHSLVALAAVTVERGDNGVWAVTAEREWLFVEPEGGWVWSAGASKYWAGNPEAVRASRFGPSDERLPAYAVAGKLDRLLRNMWYPVMAARAVGFEWGWVEHLYANAGSGVENPFKHRGFDLNTAVSMMVPQSIYDRTPGEVWPEDDACPSPLVDALAEADILCRVLAWRDGQSVS